MSGRGAMNQVEVARTSWPQLVVLILVRNEREAAGGAAGHSGVLPLQGDTE